MATDVIQADRISTLFNELEARKSLLTTCTDLYKSLSNHFETLQQTHHQKSADLDSRIEALESQTKKTLELLDQRESTIPERESAAAARIEELKESAIAELQNSVAKDGEFSDNLRSYCRKMDMNGLLKFLLSKRKESVALRSEIAAAVEEAVDAQRLVLDAVEEFVSAKFGKGGVADRRWACGVLIQAVFPVTELAPGKKAVAGSMAQRALEVAEKWRGVMGGEGGVGAGEAAMFLHMVSGFGLREKFEEEFLRKLVVEHAARRDMAKIALALGLGEKMGDIIEELVKSSKEIEAVYFAFESGLTEQFRPATLLKSYLSNSRKNVNAVLKNGNSNAAAMEQASALELNSCKTIIKCVEDFKLESEFNIDSLKKRVTQLEKAKAEKKKNAASTNKPSNKRARGGSNRDSGPPAFRSAKAGRFSNFSPSFGRRNHPQSHQTAPARYPTPYSYPSQGAYEGPGTVSYGSGYGAPHAQSSTLPQQQYSYASQDVAAGGIRSVPGAGVGVGGSYGGQTNYGAYDYSAAAAAAAAAAPPAYPPSYPQ
ncbi:FRIGIDA-like protein 4a [Malania oleifera]|uniref:FRIGIDA-like protein 4a n=1 Tax=Malania oleifera TaxID=397392 RepID=UPI0025AE8C33|nr:FRIGIDA-like protein 4a [Malania oleifera]